MSGIELSKAVLLAELAEIEGVDAVGQALGGEQHLRDAARRVAEALAKSAAEKAVQAAAAVAAVRLATDRRSALKAYEEVADVAADAGVHAENIREISRLNPAGLATFVRSGNAAEERGADAVAEAFSALGLSDAEARQFAIDQANKAAEAARFFDMPIGTPRQ